MSRDPSFVFRRQVARDRRRERRVTIVDTAQALGVGESTYAAWERGRYQPPLKRIAELAAVLQLPLTDLVAPPQPALPAQLRRAADRSIEALADAIDVPVAQVAAAEDGAELPAQANDWAAAIHVRKSTLAAAWTYAARTRPLRLLIRAANQRAEGKTVDLPDVDPAGAEPAFALADLRSLAGMTIITAGASLDIHPSTVARVENGEVLPNDPTSWATLYRLTPAQLAASWLVRAGDRVPAVGLDPDAVPGSAARGRSAPR